MSYVLRELSLKTQMVSKWQSPNGDTIIYSPCEGLKVRINPNHYALKGILSVAFLFWGNSNRLHLLRLLTISICFHFFLFSSFYK